MRRTLVPLPRIAALSVAFTLLTAPIAAAQSPSLASPVVTPAVAAETPSTPAIAATVARPSVGRGLTLTPNSPASPGPKAQAYKEPHYVRNGALVGLASGATLVLASGASQCGDGTSCGPIIVLSAVWGGIGAAVGAGIGALLEPNTSNAGPLDPGQKVHITMADGTTRTGRVTAITPTGITVDGTPVLGDQIVQAKKVTYRVEKGALIGLATGLGTGALGLLAAGCGDESNCTTGQVMGWNIAIGVGAGVAVGAFMNVTHRKADLHSDIGRRTTTMSIAPILSPTGKGMAFSMTWR